MLLPTNIFVLLMSLPLLIVSSPQHFRVQGISACSRHSSCDADNYCNGEYCVPCIAAGCGKGSICTVDLGGSIFCECPANTQGDATDQCHPVIECNDHSHCGALNRCESGRCVNPCNFVQCTEGAICRIVKREPVCLCPHPTQQNDHTPCLPLTGCITNAQCNRDEYCQSGICVNFCKSITCGQGAFCQVLEGQTQCHCYAGTEGDPYTQCFSTKDKIVGNRQSSTQVGNKGDGNQVNIHVGGAQGGNQDDAIQANNHGGGTKVVNQGGGTQVDSGTQNGSINQFNGTQSGSNAQVDSGVQVNNQGGSNLGGCRINSQCKSEERCQSGSCIDPCVSFTCGKGAICQVSHRQGQCVCPDNRQGNPHIQCNPKPECALHSNCGDNKICQSGSCVDPCALIQCGEGAVCMVSKRRGQCVCNDDTPVNPGAQCNPKRVCSNDSDCRDSETCTLGLGSCVNKCDAIQCGEGAKCQLSSENKPTCICPANTNGNPFIQCQPKQENPMNDATQPSTPSSITVSNQNLDVGFPGDNLTQTPPTNVSGEGTRLPGCLDVPDPGECRGAFKRFYYNNRTDQCDCFLFGGCDEDRIKFTWDTFEECQQICVPGNKAQGPGCKRVTVEEVQSFLEEERRNRENNSD